MTQAFCKQGHLCPQRRGRSTKRTSVCACTCQCTSRGCLPSGTRTACHRAWSHTPWVKGVCSHCGGRSPPYLPSCPGSERTVGGGWSFQPTPPASVHKPQPLKEMGQRAEGWGQPTCAWEPSPCSYAWPCFSHSERSRMGRRPCTCRAEPHGIRCDSVGHVYRPEYCAARKGRGGLGGWLWFRT